MNRIFHLLVLSSQAVFPSLEGPPVRTAGFLPGLGPVRKDKMTRRSLVVKYLLAGEYLFVAEYLSLKWFAA